MLKQLKIKTKHKSELVDISELIKESIIKSGVKNGICVVYTPHTTGSVFLFENKDPNLARDFLKKLGELVPSEAKYAHVGTNACAHIKSAITGASVNLIIEDAKPIMGQWQGIFFADFDGPREREIYLKIIG